MKKKGSQLKITHTQLLKSVKECLEWDGWEVVKIQGAFNTPGIWDLYADQQGRAIWLEIKAGKDNLSEAQQKFRNTRTKQGIQTSIIRKIEDLQDYHIVERVKIYAQKRSPK